MARDLGFKLGGRGPFWICFGTVLGSFWDHFGIIFGTILGPFNHAGTIFGTILGHFCNHFGPVRMRVYILGCR